MRLWVTSEEKNWAKAGCYSALKGHEVGIHLLQSIVKRSYFRLHSSEVVIKDVFLNPKHLWSGCQMNMYQDRKVVLWDFRKKGLTRHDFKLCNFLPCFLVNEWYKIGVELIVSTLLNDIWKLTPTINTAMVHSKYCLCMWCMHNSYFTHA